MMTDADAAALARFAGIPVEPDRLPTFVAEFTAVSGLISDLEGVAVDATLAADAPFDPAWPATATSPESNAR
jgi:hypothetical protein